jgi:hypothetical protein
MGNAGIFRGLVISRPPTLEQVKRQNRRMRLLVILSLALVCLAIIVLGIHGLWQAWQAGRWDDSYWDNFFSQVFVPFVPVSVSLFGYTVYFALLANEKVQATEALPLREAAASGDKRLAPLAEQQPTQPGSASGAADLDQGERFRPHAAMEQEKCIDILVAEQNVQWKTHQRWPWGRHHHITWSEARAFYTFSYLRQFRFESERQQVFVLDAPTATLAWVVSLPQNVDPTQESVASERLRDLIGTRTGLPLRDLTKAAEELERLLPPASSKARSSEVASGTAQLSSSLSLAPQRIKPANRQSFPYSGLIPALLIVSCAATALGLQKYEVYSYNTLLAQVQTHKPLFHDALSTPNNFWTVHIPPPLINTAPPTYGYSNGAYQLTGIDTPALTAPGIYGDVAVEVTVRLLGKQSPDDQYDTFGLLLHSDGSVLDGISFNIDPGGNWSIGPLLNTFAYTKAINTAPGAANRLAVIMRGQQHILYVNNQFVGLYQGTGPASGPLGFEAETDTASAVFTDFIIYPL